jgi:hypothetical protein
MRQARVNHERVVFEHDEAVGALKGAEVIAVCVSVIKHNEESLAEVEAEVAAALAALEDARLEAREERRVLQEDKSYDYVDEEEEALPGENSAWACESCAVAAFFGLTGPFAGIRVRLRELGDVLLKDVGGKIRGEIVRFIV